MNKLIFSILIATMGIHSFAQEREYRKQINEGNKNFEQNKWDEAVEKYIKA